MIIFMTIFICKLTGTATNVKDMCSLLFNIVNQACHKIFPVLMGHSTQQKLLQLYSHETWQHTCAVSLSIMNGTLGVKESMLSGEFVSMAQSDFYMIFRLSPFS